MTSTLDLAGLQDADCEILRGLAARMRKINELGLPPVLPSCRPIAKTTSKRPKPAPQAHRVEAAAPESPTRWCRQCERRVTQVEADQCSSKWCGASIAFEVANP